MLKVIIADDEVKVCKLIHHLIDWNDMGLDVVAIINDGEKALETIIETKPDIVITDIRMPGYDGIELIRRTKELFPDIYFIIISGYSQFEYAQNAIKYGVENYLLKPIKKKELMNTLTKIIDKHSSINMSYLEKIELQSKLHTTSEKAKKNFLSELLFHTNLALINYDIDTINKEYSSHFVKGYFAFANICPFLEPGDENSEMMALLLAKIQIMVREKLEPKCSELITMIRDDQIVCLMNTEDSDLSSIRKQFNKMKIDIANLKDIFQKVNVIVGFGDITNHTKDLYTNYEQAEYAIKCRFSNQGSYIIEYKDQNTSTNYSVTDIIDSSTKDRLLSFFEILSIDSMLAELDRVHTTMEHISNHSQLIYDSYNELVDILLFGAKQYLNIDRHNDSSWFTKQFNRFYTLHHMFAWMKDWIVVEFNKYMEIKKSRDTKPIRIAKQFINDNYNSSISLEEVSNMLGFNPAYFSSLFKKEAGENFSDYIMKTRIHHAKNFLLQSNLNIDEIAAKVGYSDIKYFTKLFKKRTGLNPSEFRKLYG